MPTAPKADASLLVDTPSSEAMEEYPNFPWLWALTYPEVCKLLAMTNVGLEHPGFINANELSDLAGQSKIMIMVSNRQWPKF